eukprot:GHVT01072797.1.p1 GENE.GHVT01072797.1~~GHVT01072797.1.p1  ORF type:complete len:1794 (-),score=170.14 GHVT01072797.1:306-5687(-)
MLDETARCLRRGSKSPSLADSDGSNGEQVNNENGTSLDGFEMSRVEGIGSELDDGQNPKKCNVGPSIWQIRREEIVNPVVIRRARVEDHDDLLSVLNEQSATLRQQYGDYFLAELIHNKDSENQVLVAEVGGKVVGLMSFTCDVDVNLLCQKFYLEPFDLFLQPEYSEIVHRTLLPLGPVPEPGNEVTDEVSHFATDVYARAPPAETAALQELSVFARAAAMAKQRRDVEGASTLFTDVGGYLQSSLKDAVDAFLNATNDNDTTVIHLPKLQSVIRHVGLPDVLGREFDLEDAVFLLLWQFNPALPAPEVPARLGCDQLLATINTFLGTTLQERKRIGRLLLNKWSKIERIARKTVDGEHHARSSSTESGLTGSSTHELVPLIEGLVQNSLDTRTGGRDTPALSTAQIIMALHWWTPLSFVSRATRATLPELLAAIKMLVHTEKLFVEQHAGSDTWLSHIPTHGKSAYCINLFAMAPECMPLAGAFLEPAFNQLFPDKLFCVISLPTDAPVPPLLLSGWTVAKPLPESGLSHALYLIHRALPGPEGMIFAPTCRPVQAADLPELEQFLADIQLESLARSLLDASQQYIVAAEKLEVLRDIRRQLEQVDEAGQFNEMAVPKGMFHEAVRKPVFVALLHGTIVGIAQTELLSQDAIRNNIAKKSKSLLPSTDGQPPVQEDLETLPHDSPVVLLRRIIMSPIIEQALGRVMLKEILRCSHSSVLRMPLIDDGVVFPLVHDLVGLPGDDICPPKGEGGYEVEGAPDCETQDARRCSHYSKLRSPNRKRARGGVSNIHELESSVDGEDTVPSGESPEEVVTPDSSSGNGFSTSGHLVMDGSCDCAASRSTCSEDRVVWVRKWRLSHRRIPITWRLIVIGITSTSLAVLHTWLEDPHRRFFNITLIAPEAKEALQDGKTVENTLQPLGALTGDRARVENLLLNDLLLSLRVRVIAQRVQSLDRRNRQLHLDNGQRVTYDYCVIATGLQDATLRLLGLSSCGLPNVSRAPPICPDAGNFDSASSRVTKDPTPDRSRLNGAVALGDSSLPKLLSPSGVWIRSLRWNPLSDVAVFGAGLDAYCLLQALLVKGVPPQKIVLIHPDVKQPVTLQQKGQSEAPQATPARADSDMDFTRRTEELLHKLGGGVFGRQQAPQDDRDSGRAHQTQRPSVPSNNEQTSKYLAASSYPRPVDPYTVNTITNILQAKGVRILKDCRLCSVHADRSGRLKTLKLSRARDQTRPVPDVSATTADSRSPSWRGSQDVPPMDAVNESVCSGKDPLGCKWERGEGDMDYLTLPCRVLICAAMFLPDEDLFRALHSSGLVCDGRVIVDSTFRTTDRRIFAGGSIAEFSRRYAPLVPAPHTTPGERVTWRRRRLRQELYDGDEVGVCLGKLVLRMHPMERRLNQIHPNDKQGSCPTHLPVHDGILGIPQEAATYPKTQKTVGGKSQDVSVPPSFSRSCCWYGMLPGDLLYCRAERCGGELASLTWWPVDHPPIRKTSDCGALGGSVISSPSSPTATGISTTGKHQHIVLDNLTLTISSQPSSATKEKQDARNVTEKLAASDAVDSQNLRTENDSAEPDITKSMTSVPSLIPTGSYCDIAVDPLQRIATITYLGASMKRFSAIAIRRLIGRSERHLNKLRERADTGDVVDLVEFLRDSWSAALREAKYDSFLDALLGQAENSKILRDLLSNTLRRKNDSNTNTKFQEEHELAVNPVRTATDDQLVEGAGRRLLLEDRGLTITAEQVKQLGLWLPEDQRAEVQSSLIGYLKGRPGLEDQYYIPVEDAKGSPENKPSKNPHE